MSVLRIDPDAIYTSVKDIGAAVGVSEKHVSRMIHSKDARLRLPVRQFSLTGGQDETQGGTAMRITGAELLSWFRGLPTGIIRCE